MYRILSLLAFIPLFFIACNDSTNNGNSKSTEQHTATGKAGSWYKRYVGTVAGQPVVVNLYFGGDSSDAGTITVTGNYYNRGKSQLIDLSADGKKDGELHLTEYVQTERDVDEDKKYPQWEITIDKSGIKGKWYSGDRKAVQEIILHENYDDAYRFDVITASDSASFKGNKDEYWIRAEHMMLIPSGKMNKEEAAFITCTLLHELEGDSLGANDFYSFIQAANNTRFAEYKKLLANDIKAYDGADENASYNWESDMSSLCVYNDKGLVVFNINEYAYTGGAHGNTFGAYICLDVREKKVWRLEDIVTVDSAKLSAMLEAAVRKTFKIKPGEPLNEHLLVDTIPVTGNVIVSDAGLTFFYNQYEIASYANGQLAFFLSYTQLSDMLRPEFKKRVGL
ncbi:MAG: hypothetical protein K0Q79_3244 [Flavipsychrobacter sp.]|jgi:hypothetical protein|nr:hypothetical protein [Flavipsychrobacter sp.]